EEDVCVPVGQNGWLKRGQEKHRYDQQPEEVSVLVFALKSMYRVTGEEKYNKMRRDAFNWFLGNNTLRQVVYNQATGGCYDGVGEKEINLNQGAESTIMYLLARLSFEE
ncbi:MAG: mannosyltransferase, partial [Bacteroidales bacterium]